MVATMSRIGPERGRSISASRMSLWSSAALEAVRSSSSYVIVVRLIDLFWLIAPELHRDGFALSWLDVLLPLSLGCVWLGCFIWQLRGRPLLPLHDPQFHETLGPIIEKTQERPI
jgi:hypothetical protein